jgi:hypothetical protein
MNIYLLYKDEFSVSIDFMKADLAHNKVSTGRGQTT